MAGPIRTSSGRASTAMPSSKKCFGASTWVPVCDPKATDETFELPPFAIACCDAI